MVGELKPEVMYDRRRDKKLGTMESVQREE